MHIKLTSRKKRSLSLLFVALASFLVLLSLIFMTSPTQTIYLGSIGFSIQLLFFLLLDIFLFSSINFAFNSRIHGVLGSLFVVSYLLFRLNNLTHPFVLILLLALFLTIELVFTKQH